MENNMEIVHSGILGQKWGQRNGPPYPLAPSAHSAKEKRLAKSSGHRGSLLAKSKAKKAANAKIKMEKAIAKQEQANAKKALEQTKLKEKIVKSRSIAKVYKHAELFDDQELRSLKDRFALESDLKKIKDSEMYNKGRKFVDTIGTVGDGLNRVANAVDNGSRAYNNVAKVMNSLYGSDMKLIGDKKETREQAEYVKVTKTKDEKGNDVTLTKKWKQ